MTDLTIPIPLLGIIFAMVAFSYASVGLGGGSSYTALLAIFGAGVTTIPMVSLTLNVLVTTVGSIIFLQLLFHKVIRYWVGFFQLTALSSNAFLAMHSGFYTGLLAGQLLFYALAILGSINAKVGQTLPPVRYALYLCLLNAAALAAFWKFVRGERQVTWAPRKG